MSTPFRVDIDDVEFVFFEQLRAHERLSALPAFAELDRDTYTATFREIKRMAEEVLHPVDRIGDRQGCSLDDEGNVTTPEGYKDAWDRMAEGGWIASSAPVDQGGSGMPRAVAMVCNEVFTAACCAFMMYPGLTAAAGRMVAAFAPDAFRDLVTQKLFTGEWSGTMCLTEAGAGSSVGDNRCKATPSETEDGVFLLEGEKVFISGGDNDLVENIVHLVLARTPGAPEGTKGLSLFLVPKYEFDAEGNLGARNGAKVTTIEHKLGINGSATCVLALGADRPCKSWLVGKERQGIELMFNMMNEARIGVAGQGVATANAAYQYSVQYAAERVQGTALMRTRDGEARRVPIIEHPDVRRMLMTLQVVAATTRAAVYRVAFNEDLAHGLEQTEPKKAEKLRQRMDLLIPVLKAHCTDLSFEMASMAVQVYGGYGFIKEYPVEQLVRDSKVQSIYEGTNGIQAMDLLGRKMRINSGALFMEWMADTQRELQEAGKEGFGSQAAAINRAIGQLGASAMHLGQLAGNRKIDVAFLQAVPFLKTFGYTLLAVEALDQARVAKKLIAQHGEERPLWVRKIAGLDFYINHLLPQAVAWAKTVQSGDESPLDERVFT
ncbi:acyl-CoA dehydrogenase [Paraliomyxa miuraensis]|uniref:acyl-CoA dehydrogenase n=1 Tax=Paraliomyxa miuraensis TaxID=376150 RepID=UPI0022517667|nr:acyl-CoA dehydrogenase [Paraliomyxa miuraensis]MCX4246286.1 acyl-CoA dehydrogenase [Paraliomyxa miuraensis]